MSDSAYSNTKIEVYLDERKLHFSSGKELPQEFPVAVGKPITPTPIGTYKIITKIARSGGILGTRWLGLNIPNGPYGIHGTSKPDSIGNAASKGCIRMYNHDVEELFRQVHIGTTVVIKKDRNK